LDEHGLEPGAPLRKRDDLGLRCASTAGMHMLALPILYQNLLLSVAKVV
jgi:hypothetical protein